MSVRILEKLTNASSYSIEFLCSFIKQYYVIHFIKAIIWMLLLIHFIKYYKFKLNLDCTIRYVLPFKASFIFLDLFSYRVDILSFLNVSICHIKYFKDAVRHG